MSVQKILTQVKSVFDVIDKWDDTAISIIKTLANLSFAPAWLKTTAYILEKYEGIIISRGKESIDYILNLLVGMTNSETKAENKQYLSKKEKSADKLSMAISAVENKIQKDGEKNSDAIEKVGEVTEKISGIIGVINSIKDLF